MKRRHNITHHIRNKWISEWEKANSESEHGVSFLNTQDFKSYGAKSRTPDYSIPGHDRNFFSTNERLFFLHLLRDQRITWIREQYPLLPLERAIGIARQLGLKYPTYPYTSNVEVVLTTDFLCGTILDQRVAYSIKDARAFSDYETWSERKKNNFESKLKLEKLFWESQNVTRHLITSDLIKTIFSKNLQQLAPFLIIDLRLKLQLPTWLQCFKSNITAFQNRPVSDLLYDTTLDLSIDYADASALFHHALWHKYILADLNINLYLEKPVELFQFEVQTYA